MSPLGSWEVSVPLVAVCIVLSGYFSGVETGLMSVSRIRLQYLERTGRDRRVASLQRLLKRIEDPILTCLIGTNVATILGSAVLTALFAVRFGHGSEPAAAATEAVLVIVFAEILPKVLYREDPERLTLASYPPLRAAMLLLAPVRRVLLAYSALVQRLLPGRGRRRDAALLGRDAMRTLLSAHPAAAQDARFGELLARCLALADLNLAGLMTPWARVVKLPRTASLAECRRVAADSGISRLPVHGDADGELLGWVLARDLLLSGGEDPSLPLPASLIRTCPAVDQAISPWALFEEMRWQRQQMAVVVDSRGNPLGLVTLEDLLEVLVGSIEDEFDRAVRAPARAAT